MFSKQKQIGDKNLVLQAVGKERMELWRRGNNMKKSLFLVIKVVKLFSL